MTQKYELVAPVAKAIRELQTPEGKLKGVTGLLDKRRIEYGIPDGAFAIEAVYDRVFCFQIPDRHQETYGGGPILKPENKAAREKDQAARAIIVSAGFSAMDHLRANGMGLGHVVRILRLAPWAMYTETIAGTDQSLLVMRDGDIVGSEDLRQEIIARPEAVELVDDQHFYRDSAGKLWRPSVPTIPADY